MCTFTGGGKEEIGKRRTIEKQAQGSNGQFCVNKDFLTITGRRDTSKGSELPVADVSIKMWLVCQEFYGGYIKTDWRLVYDFKVCFCCKIVGLNK